MFGSFKKGGLQAGAGYTWVGKQGKGLGEKLKAAVAKEKRKATKPAED